MWLSEGGRERTQDIWWIKAAVERKEVLGVRDKVAKKRCMEIYKEQKRKVKRCIYQRKRR